MPGVFGTLGAARIAPLHGVPAISVSGGAGDVLPAIANWVVQLTDTAIVRELAPLQYLTVDAPETPLAEIQGVSVVRRAKGRSVSVWRGARATRWPDCPGQNIE